MSLSTVTATVTRRDVQRQDKTRFLALVKFREQRLNFVSVQTKAMMVLHTSYLQRKAQNVKVKIVGFGTRGMHARHRVASYVSSHLRCRSRRHIWNIHIFSNTKDKQLCART